MDRSWIAERRSGGVRPMRAMGVDYGEVRIGLALSDETGTLASPLTTLRRRRGKRPPLREIEGTARSHAVHTLVFGLPLELSGEESEWTREVREVAQKLGDRLGIPVHLVDERMTSVRAERAIRSIGLPRNKREDKARLDSAAAAIILQSWLDNSGRAR
jgi:putative Holliday junction resolvase